MTTENIIADTIEAVTWGWYPERNRSFNPFQDDEPEASGSLRRICYLAKIEDYRGNVRNMRTGQEYRGGEIKRLSR